MALNSQFSLIHSEFNEFLFASVGEEKNGQLLTVLSALTRLGLDPWGEAARLSALSNETAARALAAVIARIPEGDWTLSDSAAIAARLVGRLPGRGTVTVKSLEGQSFQSTSTRDQKVKVRTAVGLACVVLIIALLSATLLRHRDHIPVPNPSPVSSTQR